MTNAAVGMMPRTEACKGIAFSLTAPGFAHTKAEVGWLFEGYLMAEGGLSLALLAPTYRADKVTHSHVEPATRGPVFIKHFQAHRVLTRTPVSHLHTRAHSNTHARTHARTRSASEKERVPQFGERWAGLVHQGSWEVAPSSGRCGHSSPAMDSMPWIASSVLGEVGRSLQKRQQRR